MEKWIFAVCMIVIWGCSNPNPDPVPIQFQELENLTVLSSDAKPAATLSFTKDAVYGDTDEVLIGIIQDVAVDNSGRVFIADAPRMVLYAFEPDGRFITRIGRDGRGPGEFNTIKSLHILGDRLYVYDPGQYRIHVFTLNDLAVEKSVYLAENRSRYPALAKTMPWISDVYVRNDDTYIAKFLAEDKSPALQHWQNYDVRGLFYLLNNTGIISGELLEFRSEIRTRFPFMQAVFDFHFKAFFGNALPVISSDNRIHIAEPDYFLIKRYGSDGVYEKAFFYPIEKIPLTQGSAIEAGVPDEYASNMPSKDLPEFWPVLTEMKIDNEDRLWVATTVGDMSVYEWWLLESSGNVFARFEWPRNKPIVFVKHDYIYTRETDDETGLMQVVRYKIDPE
ncbi:MAG: 6-bladed beta-propeller [Cyclonatronaceae bacterium]